MAPKHSSNKIRPAAAAKPDDVGGSIGGLDVAGAKKKREEAQHEANQEQGCLGPTRVRARARTDSVFLAWLG